MDIGKKSRDGSSAIYMIDWVSPLYNFINSANEKSKYTFNKENGEYIFNETPDVHYATSIKFDKNKRVVSGTGVSSIDNNTISYSFSYGGVEITEARGYNVLDLTYSENVGQTVEHHILKKDDKNPGYYYRIDMKNFTTDDPTKLTFNYDRTIDNFDSTFWYIDKNIQTGDKELKYNQTEGKFEIDASNVNKNSKIVIGFAVTVSNYDVVFKASMNS